MYVHPNTAIQDDDSLMEELQESMADTLGQVEIEIRLEMYYCDPSNPNGTWATKVNWFHTLYGRLLFWDGVRRVMRGGEEERQRKQT